MTMISLSGLRDVAAGALSQADDGAPLDPLSRALIELGVAASVTSLDGAAIGAAIERAYDAGAGTDQIQEVLSLVSGLGVHSLMVATVPLLDAARRRDPRFDAALTPDQQALWDRHVGADPFWMSFEREVPGFLDAMLRLSSDQFAAFFTYCAVPWKGGHVRARVKELIALATDATPAHRFLPGFRVHLANAMALGVGRIAIDETLDIAAAAPPHVGTR